MYFKKIVLPLALATAFVAPLSPFDLLLGADAAFAQGKSNGNGNSSGNGNGGDHGNGGNNGNSNRSNGNSKGAVASELKGLNAAHANEQALLNAAANSQVGVIATYRETTLEQRRLQEQLANLGVDPSAYDPTKLPTQEQVEEYLATLDSGSDNYDEATAEALLQQLGFSGLDDLELARTQLGVNTMLNEYYEAVGAQEAATEAVMPTGGLTEAALLEFHRLLGL